jgi:hypothetical protein
MGATFRCASISVRGRAVCCSYELPAAALISAGFTNAGLVVGAIGAGCGGVGSLITKEQGTSR